MTGRLLALLSRAREFSPRTAALSWAARRAGCPWCRWLQVHPLWPSCMCRTPCGASQCSRNHSVLAIDAAPGMRVWRDDTAALAVIASVTDPDPGGMVVITPEQGAPWRTCADMGLIYAETEVA